MDGQAGPGGRPPHLCASPTPATAGPPVCRLTPQAPSPRAPGSKHPPVTMGRRDPPEKSRHATPGQRVTNLPCPSDTRGALLHAGRSPDLPVPPAHTLHCPPQRPLRPPALGTLSSAATRANVLWPRRPARLPATSPPEPARSAGCTHLSAGAWPPGCPSALRLGPPSQRALQATNSWGDSLPVTLPHWAPGWRPLPATSDATPSPQTRGEARAQDEEALQRGGLGF